MTSTKDEIVKTDSNEEIVSTKDEKIKLDCAKDDKIESITKDIENLQTMDQLTGDQNSNLSESSSHLTDQEKSTERGDVILKDDSIEQDETIKQEHATEKEESSKLEELAEHEELIKQEESIKNDLIIDVKPIKQDDDQIKNLENDNLVKEKSSSDHNSSNESTIFDESLDEMTSDQIDTSLINDLTTDLCEMSDASDESTGEIEKANNLSVQESSKESEEQQKIEQAVNSVVQKSIHDFEPVSDLVAIDTFKEMNISEELIVGLSSINVLRPSELQKVLIPALMKYSSNNVYVRTTPYSTKKTSFLIASLERIDVGLKYPQSIIIAPTRNLVLQISDSVKKIAIFKDISIRCIVKERKFERKELSKPVEDHMLILTIGQLMRLCESKAIDLNKLKICCFDEVDVLLGSNRFYDCLREIIDKLKETECQMQFFSTCKNLRPLKYIRRQIQPIFIDQFKLEDCFKNVVQFSVLCQNKNDKFKSLANIIRNTLVDKVLIFVSNSHFGKKVYTKLKREGYRCSYLDGLTDVKVRKDLIERFKSVKQMLLIITYPLNVGIDYKQVELIINLDLTIKNKSFTSDYLHRLRSCTNSVRPAFVINIVDRLSNGFLNRMQSIYQTEMFPLDGLNLNRTF